MTIIVWFRNDLRTLDHEPLYRAAQQGKVVPVYCFDPRHFATTHDFGFPKTGAFRAQFLLESVADLQQRLTALGSPLIIRRGKPELILPQLAQETGATALYYHTDVADEEIQVESTLIHNLKPLGITPQAFWGHTLYHQDDLPFPLASLPDIFTTFRKQIESQGTIRHTLPPPKGIEGVTATSEPLPTLAELGVVPATPDPRAVLKFKDGETAGLERLRDYVWQGDHLRRYKETRNGMIGDSYSTKFSAWLAHGSLSPRTIYEDVKQYESERVKNDSTYWLLFELLWRDYFRFVALKYGNAIFQAGGIRGLEFPWRQDQDLFEAWRQGRTGYPLVDASMRELAYTGFMSNRGRQNVASFLTKNLGVDWRMGAEWFESLLVDYDVASNYGNWNYAAGVGNDPRNFRFFNIFKQAEQYDPQGDYVKLWLPELTPLPPDKIHRPMELTPTEQQVYGVHIGQKYPAYIVPLFDSATINEQLYQHAFLEARNRR